MAQRESITAITLVICQSCRAMEERVSHSHATLSFHPPPILLLLLSPPCPSVSTNGRSNLVTCPFSSRHQASVEHRREMAPIPDTPQKPQSHPIIREAQDPTGEAEKDTLWLWNIVPLHHSVWHFFNIWNLAFKNCSSKTYLLWFRVSEQVIIIQCWRSDTILWWHHKMCLFCLCLLLKTENKPDDQTNRPDWAGLHWTLAPIAFIWKKEATFWPSAAWRPAIVKRMTLSVKPIFFLLIHELLGI